MSFFHFFILTSPAKGLSPLIVSQFYLYFFNLNPQSYHKCSAKMLHINLNQKLEIFTVWYVIHLKTNRKSTLLHIHTTDYTHTMQWSDVYSNIHLIIITTNFNKIGAMYVQHLLYQLIKYQYKCCVVFKVTLRGSSYFRYFLSPSIITFLFRKM